ncbi:chloride channel protein [soil metagenome]
MAAAADRGGGRFLLLAALVGVTVGIGAWALVECLHFVSEAVADLGVASGSLWALVVIPVAFLAAWAIARYAAPEVAGDGVPEATASLLVAGGVIRGRVAPLKILATGLTVGAGGSAGREGPIVLVGASIGSKVARLFNLGEDQVRSLVAAGAGAGIGASFNAPIAGMLFALEVILSSFAVRHMSAVVVASVAAAITSRTLVGEELALNAASYTFRYPRELILYAGLALVIVVAAVIFLRLLDRLGRLANRSTRRPWLRPLGFGLIVASLVVAEPFFLGTDEARLVGTGQAVTNHLLETAAGADAITTSLAEFWWVLALVALAKVVASAFTLTSGGSGGAFMPSLFIGAMLGTAFAKLVGPLWTVSPISTGSFAVVGMAAMFAAMGRAPLTAVLLVFEITGTREYGLILPLMLTAILATFLSELFHRESVYTMPLRWRGISQVRRGEVDVLDTISVGEVMSPARLVVTPSTSLADLKADFERHRAHGAPVIDESGSLVGIVTVTDAVGASGDDARVAEVMTRRPTTVTPSARVSEAMARMSSMGVGRLPVVADDDPTQLVGMFRREDAVKAYHEALGAQTDHQLERSRLAQRTDPGAGYYHFRIPPGSIADGKEVRAVAWPEGSTLVSVRRGREVLVPEGTTSLYDGDVVTAFGSELSRQLMIQRLNAGAEEPTAEIALEPLEDPDRTDDAPD